jgi:hypothetical protein
MSDNSVGLHGLLQGWLYILPIVKTQSLYMKGMEMLKASPVLSAVVFPSKPSGLSSSPKCQSQHKLDIWRETGNYQGEVSIRN